MSPLGNFLRRSDRPSLLSAAAHRFNISRTCLPRMRYTKIPDFGPYNSGHGPADGACIIVGKHRANADYVGNAQTFLS